MSNLLTPQQVAERLAVEVWVLRQWRAEGTGPRALRLGHRTVRYREEDINEWLEARVALREAAELERGAS